MNLEKNNNKFISLLAQGNKRREQRPPNRAIDNIEEIMIQIKSLTPRYNLNKNENNRLIFRFQDLKTTAKNKFAEILKKDSSLITVNKLEVEKIKKRLEKTNPVIASNWGETFCHGSFNRYKERQLSRLIYCLGKEYNATEQEINNISFLIE